jgi:D-glycero-alpha-D-manno-heptose-7-phosphate kinase
MIISKTPLRMSWVGGGSDLPSFYREELGAVISTSINKYIYIALNPKFDGKIRLNYSRTEEVSDINQIEHPIFKQTLLHMGIKGGIEIASMADIPSKGSGLGSSSSFTVGLLNALYAYNNQYVSKEKLAKEACHIEINKCNEPIGKQDQYAAAFGGINLIKFHGNEDVTVEPIICNPDLYKNIEECTIVFYTGRTRSAFDLLARQSKELASLEKKNKMRRMVELAFILKTELESNSITNFGEILHENWILKSELTHGITDNQLNKWYNDGIKNGAKGGKLLGAGNGGFLMFFAEPQYHKNIENALAELQKVNIKFDNAGTQIVFYQPNQNI